MAGLVVPILETLLDKYDKGEGRWYIDRLEINLPPLPENAIGKTWASLLSNLLEEELKLKLFQLNAESFAQEMGSDLAENDSKGHKAKTVTEKNAIEAFFHYLEQGYLPWWMPPINSFDDFWTGVKNAIPAFRSAFIEALTGLAKRSVPLLRWIRQIDDEAKWELLHTAELPDWRELWQKTYLFTEHLEKKNTLQSFWQLYFNTLNATTSPKDTANWTGFQQQLLHDLQNKPTPGKFDECWSDKQLPPSGGGSLPLEGISVNQAGLVILNPFLTHLFDQCGYREQGGRILASCYERAIKLLDYCTTGNSLSSPEFELVLAKVLCGLPPDYPLPNDNPLSDYEKNAANELLEAVIEYWKALKNTSVEGLRQSFLQRTGVLYFEDGAWLLRVENRTWDVLLNQLPWPVSIIKLPWMEPALRVDWTG